MRAKTTMFVSVLFLMLSMLSFAQPTAAAPAQPFSYSECYDFGWVLCFEGHGVYQENQSASGNTKYTYNATGSFTVRDENGQVIYEGEDKYHSTFVAKNGELQVNHSRGSGSFTYLGESCTYSYNTIFANGEIRHEVYNFDCN